MKLPFLLAAGLLLSTAAESSYTIKFEEVSASAGINFTHSFGAEKLGSLLESTGAGAVWFDYDNDGLMDLYVTSGRDLGKGMHPYPLRKPQTPAPHNHLFHNLGNGKFADVTDAAGVAGDGFSFAAIAADYDNDGHTDSWSPATATLRCIATAAMEPSKTPPPRPAWRSPAGPSARPGWTTTAMAASM